MALLYLLVFCRVAIGLVFLISTLGKARDLAGFQQTIRTFNLLPRRLSGPAALLFVCSEAIVVILIALGGVLLLPGFLLALGLLLLFCVALASVLARNIQTSCHCFGASKTPVSSLELWRNVGFILCALGGCLALLWAKDTAPSLSLPEWFLPGLAAALFVLLWSQLGEIAQLFRQG
jgi:uncharacterized membrane protein YphA (DoxX/SURF4 family)